MYMSSHLTHWQEAHIWQFKKMLIIPVKWIPVLIKSPSCRKSPSPSLRLWDCRTGWPLCQSASFWWIGRSFFFITDRTFKILTAQCCHHSVAPCSWRNIQFTPVDFSKDTGLKTLSYSHSPYFFCSKMCQTVKYQTLNSSLVYRCRKHSGVKDWWLPWLPYDCNVWIYSLSQKYVECISFRMMSACFCFESQVWRVCRNRPSCS